MHPELAESLSKVDSATLGARIKAARKAAGLRQPQLAGDDVSVTYVSRIEKGLRRPSPQLLEAFALRLGVPVIELVNGFEPSSQTSKLALELDYIELEISSGGDPVGALRQVDAALESLSSRAANPLRSRALHLRASALEASGSADEAAAAFEVLLMEASDTNLRLRSAVSLSRILRESGNFSRSVEVAERELDRAKAAAVVSDETVRLMCTLAATYHDAGDVDRAKEICEHALLAADELQNPRARASAYWNTSVIEAEDGSTDRALELARRALFLLEQEAGQRDLAALRTQLSIILLRTDPPQVAEAREQLAQADRELTWSGASRAERNRTTIVTARALYLGGELDDALAALDEAQIDREKLPLVYVTAQALRGQIEASAGRIAEAQQTFVQAVQVLTGVGADREAALLWFELASLLEDVGLGDEARDAYRRAAVSSGLALRSQVLRVVRSE